MNKAKFITTRYLLRSTPFISGIINIIFFLCFEKYNTCKSDIINEKYGDKIVKTIDHILPVYQRIIFLKKLLIESLVNVASLKAADKTWKKFTNYIWKPRTSFKTYEICLQV